MHIMIDLETMGQSSNCPVASIGAVAFNGENIGTLEDHMLAGNTFEAVLDLSMQSNRKWDGSTVYWWLNQEEAARNRIQKRPLLSPQDGLMALREWIKKYQPMSGKDSFWSYGASFDLPILESMFRQYGVPNPITYWKGLCARTITSLGYPNKPPKIDDHLGHSALDDAHRQAVWLTDVFNRLRMAGFYV